MATISSHVLDAVNGCSAAGMTVVCTRIDSGGSRQNVFQVETDSEGRISTTVEVAAGDSDEYELEFKSADYFDGRGVAVGVRQVMRCVVVRITMPDPSSRYHIPVIVSPHSQSMWWSA